MNTSWHRSPVTAGALRALQHAVLAHTAAQHCKQQLTVCTWLRRAAGQSICQNQICVCWWLCSFVSGMQDDGSYSGFDAEEFTSRSGGKAAAVRHIKVCLHRIAPR